MLGELPVTEEEVERLHHFVDHQAGTADVFEPDVDLTGSVEDVRRPAGAEERHDDGDRQQCDEGHGREVGHQSVGEMRHREGASMPQDGTGHEQQGDGQEDDAQTEQTPLADPLTGVSHVGRRGPDHM